LQATSLCKLSCRMDGPGPPDGPGDSPGEQHPHVASILWPVLEQVVHYATWNEAFQFIRALQGAHAPDRGMLNHLALVWLRSPHGVRAFGDPFDHAPHDNWFEFVQQTTPRPGTPIEEAPPAPRRAGVLAYRSLGLAVIAEDEREGDLFKVAKYRSLACH